MVDREINWKSVFILEGYFTDDQRTEIVDHLVCDIISIRMDPL